MALIDEQAAEDFYGALVDAVHDAVAEELDLLANL